VDDFVDDRYGAFENSGVSDVYNTNVMIWQSAGRSQVKQISQMLRSWASAFVL